MFQKDLLSKNALCLKGILISLLGALFVLVEVPGTQANLGP